MTIKKVLVVDDAAVDRLNLETVLTDAGYKVVSCKSGAEAIDLAAEEDPDLIFMDIVMEDMDGYQACRKIKQRDGTRDIPVAMVTSKDQSVDRLWAEKQGASAYVVKPYTAEEIEKKIAKLDA